VVPYSIVY